MDAELEVSRIYGEWEKEIEKRAALEVIVESLRVENRTLKRERDQLAFFYDRRVRMVKCDECGREGKDEEKGRGNRQ